MGVAMINNLIQRVRDRRVLLIISVLCAMLLSELVIYIPWDQSLKHQMQQVADEQSMINFLQDTPQLAAQKPTLTNSQFLAYISEQLHQPEFKGFTYKLQQISAQEVRLIFERVPYATLMHWLWLMSNNQHVIFSQLDLTQISVPGLVRASVVVLLRGVD